jgi:hypothetical protein|tara:strand:- start:574 stop:768 length:195 start_codon:yes stop_codon:yes gene_type:complete
MSESLIQRNYVGDEGLLYCKPLSLGKKMTLPSKEVLAKSVPAAAVRRVGQVLFGIIWRKGCVDG